MSARRKIMNKNYEANETNNTNNAGEVVGALAGVGFVMVIAYLIFKLVLIGTVAPGMMEQRDYIKGRINTMNTGFVDMDCDGIPDETWDENDFGLNVHNQIMYIQELQRTWND